METMIGTNNWKLTLRRDGDGVTLLRAATCDARAALPETLFALPVRALGDHALVPDAASVEGETVTIAGAPCDAPWDNRALRELSLPHSLRAAGDYALMNCRALETLRLGDRHIDWGVGALMNCRALRAVAVTRCGGEPGDAAAYFSGELSCELELSILGREGCEARLVFPEYWEEYVENGPAHHFDYQVHGMGQPYHQAFRGKTLAYYDYDALWRRLISGEPDGAALRLAWWRVRYPAGLTADAAARYRAYLDAHAAEALLWLLERRDAAMLADFLRLADPDADALRAASARARELRDAAATAALLEAVRRKGAGARRFEL